MTIMGIWIDELVENVGQHIKIETTDGMDREGLLSGLRSDTILWNGKVVEIITQIELNGDIYDEIPINRISRLDFI